MAPFPSPSASAMQGASTASSTLRLYCLKARTSPRWQTSLLRVRTTLATTICDPLTSIDTSRRAISPRLQPLRTTIYPGCLSSVLAQDGSISTMAAEAIARLICIAPLPMGRPIHSPASACPTRLTSYYARRGISPTTISPSASRLTMPCTSGQPSPSPRWTMRWLRTTTRRSVATTT